MATAVHAADAADEPVSTRLVTPVAAAERDRLNLSPFYARQVDADGFPILGSDKVADAALLEAAHLIDRMLDGRDDIRKALVRNKVRFTVMAHSEMTTIVPEHSDLTPPKYWDRRARGLGATRKRPCVSCGEENLLRYPGDPYATENILIHEFAHAIHEMGLNSVDPTFDKRLQAVYDSAMNAGLWKGKYAANNRMEYWAEAVQSWFDTNRENDHDHNHVNTRAELKEYDPAVAKLCAEIFGDKPWRYVRPEDRKDKKDIAHLQGYDRLKAPTFTWPAELKDVDLKRKN